MDGPLATRIRAANHSLLVEGDRGAVDDFFAPDYVGHLTEQDIAGARGVRGFLGALQSAFPEIDVAVDVLLEHGDRVAWQRTLRGKHTGSFMGFPATGRDVVWRDMITSRFEADLIAEEWAISDLAEHLLKARHA